MADLSRRSLPPEAGARGLLDIMGRVLARQKARTAAAAAHGFPAPGAPPREPRQVVSLLFLGAADVRIQIWRSPVQRGL